MRDRQAALFQGAWELAKEGIHVLVTGGTQWPKEKRERPYLLLEGHVRIP